MGMYTGLRGKILIKPQYSEQIATLTEGDKEWEDVFPFMMEEFLTCSRSRFIPFGTLCYMPEEWEDNYDIPRFDPSTRIWKFTCSLKNYSNEIEKFIDFLDILAEAWNLEELYEEWGCPKLYEHNLELIKE